MVIKEETERQRSRSRRPSGERFPSGRRDRKAGMLVGFRSASVEILEHFFSSPPVALGAAPIRIHIFRNANDLSNPNVHVVLHYVQKAPKAMASAIAFDRSPSGPPPAVLSFSIPLSIPYPYPYPSSSFPAFQNFRPFCCNHALKFKTSDLFRYVWF